MLWVLNSLSYRFPYQIWKLGNRFNFHRSDHLGFSAPKCGFNGFHGVKAKVFSNQLGFYMLANNQWFPNDQRKIVFCLGYLYGQEISWAKPRIQNVFNWKPMWYSRFTRNFEAMYLTPRRKAKAEKGSSGTEENKGCCAMYPQVQPECLHHQMGSFTPRWVIVLKVWQKTYNLPYCVPISNSLPWKAWKSFLSGLKMWCTESKTHQVPSTPLLTPTLELISWPGIYNTYQQDHDDVRRPLILMQERPAHITWMYWERNIKLKRQESQPRKYYWIGRLGGKMAEHTSGMIIRHWHLRWF